MNEESQTKKITREYKIDLQKQTKERSVSSQVEQFCDTKGAFLEFKKKPKIDVCLKNYNAHMFEAEEQRKLAAEQKLIIDEAMELQKGYIQRKMAKALMHKVVKKKADSPNGGINIQEALGQRYKRNQP